MERLGPPEPAGHRDAVFGLTRGERLLLVRNERTVGGGRRLLWDLPGGGARPGESLVEALEREWREETGLACHVGDLMLVVDGAKRRSSDAPPLYTWRAFFFEVLTEGEPHAGEGIEDVRWVDRKAASQFLDGPYHGALRRHLQGEPRRHATTDWIDAGGPAGDPGTRRIHGLRPLLVLASAAAVGDLEIAAEAVSAALAEGIPARRIEETLLQIVPYAGFPRAIAAFGRVRPLLGPPPPLEEVVEPCASGIDTFDRVYGETSRRVRQGLRGLHPELQRWTEAFAYGRVLARPRLELPERELIAISALTALGRLEEPLLGHMRAAVRLGVEPTDVAAAIALVPSPGGEERRTAARKLLERLS